MTTKKYPLPAIVWVRITDYMHGWLQHELAGEVRIGEQRVVSVQHLEGARRILRMETEEDMAEMRPVELAMSATRHNVIEAGLQLDAPTVHRLYGITPEELSLFVPVECPRLALTENGVLRPWTDDTCFGHKQSYALQHLIRKEFWKEVREFDRRYAKEKAGLPYPDIDMIEAFCEATKTPEDYADAMRREWLRQKGNAGADEE